jgi:hypothetical protein
MTQSLENALKNCVPIIGYVHGDALSDGLSMFPPPKGRYFEVSLATEDGPIRVQNCGTILVATAHDLVQAAQERGQVPKNFTLDIAPPESGDLVSITIGEYNHHYPPEHRANYFIIVDRLLPEIHLPNHRFLFELEVLLARTGKV